jgi:outer membrane receptor for ferrienterochelin and colicin
LPALTLNTGFRFDAVNQFTNENQVSPRVNLVMKATDTTTVHAGYSRYFVPPPFELVAPAAIALFNNTTAASTVQQEGIVKAERSHYFDVGVNQIIVPGLTIGLDGYYKLAQISSTKANSVLRSSCPRSITRRPMSPARNSP